MEDNNTNETNNNEPTSAHPQIYVASLADYNAGRLHGAWIDATEDPTEISDQIEEMLDQSPEPDAEEWAIHDHQGFGPWQPGEHETIDTITRIATGITEHGDAYAALATEMGTDPDMLDQFEDIYLGHWPSITKYAEEILNDLIDVDALVPDWIGPYVRVDVDAYARDLSIELHTTDAAHRGVHIFQP